MPRRWRDWGKSQQAELTGSDGAAQDEFGWSVAVDGSTAVVGALQHTTAGSNQHQGEAYVFVESGGTWSQQAKLTASDGAFGDYFGFSVAVSGNTAIVGAAYRNGQEGAAYVFTDTAGTWSQQAELTASDGAPNHYFGESVAVDGSTAVVGANDFNKAYVFAESGGKWSQQTELTASGSAQLGLSVSVRGSTLVAGAWATNVGSNSQQGAAYVFVPAPVSLSLLS
jgi:hypothetical protein